MNTYFEYTNKELRSVDFFAVRDAKNFKHKGAVRVKSTKKLRELAKIGCIPTYRLLENGNLSLL